MPIILFLILGTNFIHIISFEKCPGSKFYILLLLRTLLSNLVRKTMLKKKLKDFCRVAAESLSHTDSDHSQVFVLVLQLVGVSKNVLCTISSFAGQRTCFVQILLHLDSLFDSVMLHFLWLEKFGYRVTDLVVLYL